MATADTTHIPTRWDAAFADLGAAKMAADALADHGSGALRDEILSLPQLAAWRIFRISAPTLWAVSRKLELFWGESLFREDVYTNEWRQRIVGDLRRIERLEAGIEEPDATGGLDVVQARQDWTDAVRKHDRLTRLLRTGPSAEWGSSTRSDIVALIDEAETSLLVLPALTLDAVIKKLEILWADDRFDPVFDGHDHLLILRDIRRFALAIRN